ncbi:MAG: CoA pyrophosphatase, partial [Variibacter sp.]
MDASTSRSPGHEFFALARARLNQTVDPALTDPDIVPPLGDHENDPVLLAIADVRPIRPAAVLIPVVDHPEPTVLLTLRTEKLSSHAGQVAFPGGKIDPDDASPRAAALREAKEEIGLDARFVEPLGYSDTHLTTTGYRIAPTVARVTPGFTLTPNPSEVADVFEVPLAILMGPENHQRQS